MEFEDVLSNTKLTYFIVYIFIVFGCTFALFFKNNNIAIFIFSTFILPNSCLFLTILYDKILKNKNKEFLTKFIKFYKFIGYFSLVLTPTLLSYYFFNNINNPPLFTYIITIITTYTLSLILIINLRERLQLKNKLDETEKLKSELIIIFGLISGLFLKKYSIDISNVINEIMKNITNISTISLAIIMLCATLSALTFTYYTTTDKNETIKRNGQYYFISTILSMALTVIIFLLTIISPLIGNINVNPPTAESTILLSIYAFFIIVSFILFIYISYYLIVPSILTLKILGFIKKGSLTDKLICKLIKIKKNNWWVTISLKHK